MSFHHHNTISFVFFLLMPALIQAENHADDQKYIKSEEEGCVQDYASEKMLDKTQAVTFTAMCKTVRWVDRLFGKQKPFDHDNFGGKIIIGFKDSEKDGFDPKLRIRINSKLPNASTRLNAFIGRVNDDEYISDSNQRPDSAADTAIRRREEEEAQEFIIGLGYSNPKIVDKGFYYSMGAKISSGLDPYGKVRYLYKFKMPEKHFLRAAQTVFWRNDDGYGTTSNLNYNYLYGLGDILELAGSAKFTQDEDQWEWVAATTWYHRLKSGHGLATRAFIRAEEESSESIPEYGMSLSYRRPFLRDWLFFESAVEYIWIKDFADEPRETSLGVGLQFEMVFGELRGPRR